MTADQAVFARATAALGGEPPATMPTAAPPSTAPVPITPKVGGPTAPTALLLALLAASALLFAAGWAALRRTL